MTPDSGTFPRDSGLFAKKKVLLAGPPAGLLRGGASVLSLAGYAVRVAEIAPQALANELRRIAPAEVLVSEDAHLEGYFLTRLPPWQFDVDNGKKKLLKQLGAATLAGPESWLVVARASP